MIDDFWYKKESNGEKYHIERPESNYEDVHMPKSTYFGFLIAMSFGLFGFAMVWHMWIPGLIGFFGIPFLMILKTFNLDVDYYVSGKQVHDIEVEHFKEAHS